MPSDSNAEGQLDIKDFLAPADVIVDMHAADKEQLLRELSQRAAAALGVDAEFVAAEILKREELGSTGMGEGIAIPHARIPKLDKPFGILVRLKKAIDFAAIDEQPVDLVFLLLLPGAAEGATNSTHWRASHGCSGTGHLFCCPVGTRWRGSI